MDKPFVFLDANVVIAALLSLAGGSSYVLRENGERFRFQTNEHVHAEVQEVLSNKLKDKTHLPTALFLLLGIAGVETVPNPSKSELALIAKIISKKDRPILASAMAQSDFLLTLDNEFFTPSVIEAAEKQDLKILKPGDFIRLFDF